MNMLSDPWRTSGSRGHEDPLGAAAMPSVADPWATQEQPTVEPAPLAADVAALAQELVGAFVAPMPAAPDELALTVLHAASLGGAPVAPPGPVGPIDALPLAAPSLAFEIPAARERTAVPMPELDASSSRERTLVAGRYGSYDFVVRLADRQGHPVDGPLLLGRRPDPLRAPEGARLVVIDDPQRTVSRSHLLVEPGADGILLRNLSMVNAFVLVSPGGDETEVEPGGGITVTGACSVILGAYPLAVERA